MCIFKCKGLNIFLINSVILSFLSFSLFSGASASVQPQDLPSDAEEKEEEAYPRKRARATPPSQWKTEDIAHPPMPEYTHLAPEYIRCPFEYFPEMFTVDLIDHDVYQTNLCAQQNDVKTTFSINKHELLIFFCTVIYVSTCTLPSIEDYWATATRVRQVADIMSSKHLRLLRTTLHVHNNERENECTDKFCKIRPIYTSIMKQFLRVSATPVQSKDEVTIAYKGNRAGNLYQDIQTKPDKWSYKLFHWASVDGFIHDILM